MILNKMYVCAIQLRLSDVNIFEGVIDRIIAMLTIRYENLCENLIYRFLTCLCVIGHWFWN